MQAGVKLGLAVFTVAFSASIYAMQPASTNEGSPTVSPVDVAKTPSPGGPVPIPYPNIGQPTEDSSQKQKIDGATPPIKNQSTFKHSTGDEAATPSGGVVSNKIKGKAESLNFSADVKQEGKQVQQVGEAQSHNNKGKAPIIIVRPKPALRPVEVPKPVKLPAKPVMPVLQPVKLPTPVSPVPVPTPIKIEPPVKTQPVILQQPAPLMRR